MTTLRMVGLLGEFGRTTISSTFTFVGRVLNEVRLFFATFINQLLFTVLLLAIGILWFEFHATILTTIDRKLHCDLKTYYEEEWKDILESVNEWYDAVVCWTNALAHFGRLFSGKLLLKEAGKCALNIGRQSDVGFFATLKGIGTSISIALRAIYTFFFQGIGTRTISVYIIVTEFQGDLQLFNDLFTCICQTIYVLYDLVTRALSSNALACSFHQYGNAFVSLAQIFANYGISFVTQLFKWITSGGSFTGFVNLIFRQATVLSLPNLTPVVERFLAGSLNLGRFLDDVILVVGCTLASEIDNPDNYTASHIAYNACYLADTYRVPIFETYTHIYPLIIFPSWQPGSLSLMGIFTGFIPTLSPGYRLISVVYTFLINLDRVFDPSQNYLRDEWKWEWLTDSLVDPPQRYGRISTLWNQMPSDTMVQEYQKFGLFLPNLTNVSGLIEGNTALLFGYNNSVLPSCNTSYPSFGENISYIPCQECQRIGNVSFEYKMCQLGAKIDYLLFNLTNSPLLSNGQQRRLFQTLFCCFIPRIIRVAISVFNYPVNFIRNWNTLGTFLRQDQWLHAIIDEVGGRENELGGLLKCLQDLFVYLFDPKLLSVINLVILPGKSGSEFIRSGLLLLPRMIGTILGPAPGPIPINTTEPVVDGPLSGLDQTLGTYLCLETTSPRCLNLESAMQWMRVPRAFPINQTNYQTAFNSTVVYRPVLPLNSSHVRVPLTFSDCLGEVINLKFISDFYGEDILQGFDLSCGFRFAARAAIEGVKFVISVVVVSLETLFNYIFGTTQKISTFLLLEWLACSQNTIIFNNVSSPPNNFYCSNLADFLSDLDDFLTCPCVFFLDIEVISGATGKSGGIALNCLCDFTSSVAKIASTLVRAVIAFVDGLLKITSCLIKDFPPPFDDADCDADLADRFIEAFSFLDQTFDYVVDLFASVGCLLGNMFGRTTGGQCIGGLQPCLPPQPPKCTMSYYLALSMADLAGIVVNILQTPISIVINLLRTTLVGSSLSGFPTSFVQILSDIVLSIAVGLWGDQTATPNPSLGFLQHFGLFLTCTFGPWNCSLTSPTSCTGNLLIQIGNNIRQYFTLLYCVVFNALFFLETLIFSTQSTYCVSNNLPPGGACAQSHLEAAVKCFAELLFTLLFGGDSGTSIVSFVFSILKAIAGLIPVIGDGLVAILEVLQTVFEFILDIAGSVLLGLICVITFGQVCPSKKRSDFVDFTTLKNWFTEEEGSEKREAEDWWHYYYRATAKYHKILYKFLYGKDSSKPGWGAFDENAPNTTSFLFKAFRKRFASEELQTVPTNVFSSPNAPTLFNQSEFNTVTNMRTLLDSIDKNTFCFRLLNSTIPKVEQRLQGYIDNGTSPENVIEDAGMTLPEELLFRACYTAIIFPYVFNAASRAKTVQDQLNAQTNLNSFFPSNEGTNKRATVQEAPEEYAWGTMPYDILYKPLTGLTLMRNMVGALGYYAKWKKEIRTVSSFKMTPATMTMDLDPSKDISTPLDLDVNTTLSTLFLSDPQFLSSTLSANSMKRAADSSSLNTYLTDRIVVGTTFNEYLKRKGIDCPYTESAFKSLDNFLARSASLNLVAVKSSSLLMTLQYELTKSERDPTLLSDPQFGGDGMPTDNSQTVLNGGNGTFSKKRVYKPLYLDGRKLEAIPRRINTFITLWRESLHNFRRNTNSFQLLSHVYKHGVASILVPTNRTREAFSLVELPYEQMAIRYDTTHLNQRMPADRSHTHAESELRRQITNLPIFLQRGGGKRNVQGVRVPIMQYLYSVYNISYTMMNVLYRRQKLALDTSVQTTDNPWRKFTHDYVLERLSEASGPTSLETFYYQAKSLGQRLTGNDPFRGSTLEQLMTEVRKRSSKKRQVDFGFNTSCLILDKFLNDVCIILHFSFVFSILPEK